MMLTASPGDNQLTTKINAHCFGRAGYLYEKTLALLGALCLFLSAVEYMIPKPLPFMRIGLANLPLMLACNIFPLHAFLILICVKVFGQALITGTLFSYIFLFSAAGTFLSALVMFCLRRVLKDRITFIGIGTAGAVISNVSQLALAYFFIFRESVRFIAPPFLAAGLVTGIALGVFCNVFINRSLWYKKLICNYKENFRYKNEENARRTVRLNDEDEKGCKIDDRNPNLRFVNCNSAAKFLNNSVSARALFISAFVIMPALLFNPSTEYRVFQFLLFMLFAVLCGKKVNLFVTFFVILVITAFNLIIPYGQVLFSAGAFKITSGALKAGIHRAITLQALVMLSKVTVRDDLELPGAFGGLLGESLRIFASLVSRKMRITKGNFISGIDNLLMEFSQEKPEQSEPPQTYSKVKAQLKQYAIKTKPSGFFILTIAVLLSWLPWIFI